VLLGLAMGAAGLTIYGLAPTGLIYLFGIPVWAMSGFTNPGLMGLMTRRVGPQNQGQLQGVSQSVQGIASVLGPPLFGLSFSWAVRNNSWLHEPGLPILVSSGLLVVALVLSLRVASPSPVAATT
jgi:DHA1 family tetracycline resistance protein-like MFS transporter